MVVSHPIADDRPSLIALYGVTLPTAFWASLAGPFLSCLIILFITPLEAGPLDAVISLFGIPLLMFLFAFPIGLLALAIAGPFTTRLCFNFIRSMPRIAVVIGAALGSTVGSLVCWAIFDRELNLALIGAICGATYGGIWIWLCWRSDAKQVQPNA